MQIVAVEYVSLDGVAQAPARGDEDSRDGFDRGGWASPLFDADPEAAAASFTGSEAAVGMLFGRRTHLDLVGWWLGPDAGGNPYSAVLRDTPKHVVSSTLTAPLPYPNSQVVAGGVRGVAELKAGGEGEIVVLGSVHLVQSLLAARLVDRLVLTVLPVVLGHGLRLFADTPLELRTTENRAFGSGITVARHEVRYPDAA